MERQEEARWQEEVQRHNEQRLQHVKTANCVDVKTNDVAARGGKAAGEGTAHEEWQQSWCIDITNDNDNNANDNDSNDEVVPIFALFYWLLIVWLIVIG